MFINKMTMNCFLIKKTPMSQTLWSRARTMVVSDILSKVKTCTGYIK